MATKPDDATRIVTSTGLATEVLLKNTALIPEEVRKAFRLSLGTLTCAEEAMWRDVAARATLDAFGVIYEGAKVKAGMHFRDWLGYARIVTDARQWFTTMDAFDTMGVTAALVFQIANVDLKPVQRAVEALAPLQEPADLQGRYKVRKGPNLQEARYGTCA